MKSVGTQGNRISSNGIKNRTVKWFCSSWSARFSHFSVFFFMKSIHGELKALISPPNAHVGQLNCINCSISVLFSGLESIMMFMVGVGWQIREFPTAFWSLSLHLWLDSKHHHAIEYQFGIMSTYLINIDLICLLIRRFSQEITDMFPRFVFFSQQSHACRLHVPQFSRLFSFLFSEPRFLLHNCSKWYQFVPVKSKSAIIVSLGGILEQNIPDAWKSAYISQR